MKINIYIVLLLSGLSGCVSSPKMQRINPFSEIQPSDISKISLCFEDRIIGLDPLVEISEHEIADPTIYSEFYLHPTGVAIRDKQTIKKICNALKNSDFSKPVSEPAIGILGYQVFFGKDNEILASTYIVNYQSIIGIGNQQMKNGWIGFVFDGSIPQMSHCSTYCRLIYEFMKENLPEEIEKQDKGYRELKKGLTLESLLFDKIDFDN